ncbi:hypothetical protein LSH36_155g03038 [Paralvinella palmiformis]|uniref:acylglycerol lipase n=1 Tax=Paralvinella palmiformis TaxID=53620 RepID=A0AAD9JUQ4_9ANNE|nr:hypothetical protein LSH36_155g03038 [Paralvinella palmiformis]
MHVVAVDAPGHGKTKHVNDNDLRPKVMAQRLNQFIKKKNLDKEKIHLIGWAMGGTIAGFYAAQYPDDLKLLSLVVPGMHSPITSQAFQETIDGNTNVLHPITDEEQHRLWKIIMYKNNDFSKPVLDYIERKKLMRRKDHLTVMRTMIEDVVAKEDNLFIKEIRNIRTPTQIIWGEKDALQHISGADLLMSTLRHHVKRMDIVTECGHAFYAEEPYTLAGLLMAFQMDYRLNSEKWRQESNHIEEETVRSKYDSQSKKETTQKSTKPVPYKTEKLSDLT